MTVHHLPVVPRHPQEHPPDDQAAATHKTFVAGLRAVAVLGVWWVMDLLNKPINHGYYRAADTIDSSARREIAWWAVVILLLIAATATIATLTQQPRWWAGTAIFFYGYIALTFVRLFDEDGGVAK